MLPPDPLTNERQRGDKHCTGLQGVDARRVVHGGAIIGHVVC